MFRADDSHHRVLVLVFGFVRVTVESVMDFVTFGDEFFGIHYLSPFTYIIPWVWYFVNTFYGGILKNFSIYCGLTISAEQEDARESVFGFCDREK